MKKSTRTSSEDPAVISEGNNGGLVFNRGNRDAENGGSERFEGASPTDGGGHHRWDLKSAEWLSALVGEG